MWSRSLSFLFVVALASCSQKETAAPAAREAAPDASVGPAVVAEASAPRRPALPGDVKHGWELFKENCTGCHGSSRRGTGAASAGLPMTPADLRDPVLLARSSNAELAEVILHGIARPGVPAKKDEKRKKKEMPGFEGEIGEQGALDIIAFLRGDSIYLEECFADATHFVRAPVKAAGPPMYAAYAAGVASGSPRVLENKEDLPAGAALRGYVSFAELDLPGAGATPVAFVTAPDGKVSGVRVALPEPDNRNAAKDIEAVLASGPDSAPRLRPVVPAIAALSEWLGQATRELR